MKNYRNSQHRNPVPYPVRDNPTGIVGAASLQYHSGDNTSSKERNFHHNKGESLHSLLHVDEIIQSAH